MPWSGGTYSRLNGNSSCANDEAAAVGITSANMDARFNDFEGGINNCITKDGQVTVAANIPMGGFNFTNVGSATAGNQFPSANQVINNLNFAATSGTSTAYTLALSLSSAVSITTGAEFLIQFHTASGASPTLSINGGTALNIVFQNSVNVVANAISTFGYYRCFFNGTKYVIDYWQAATVPGNFTTADQITSNALLSGTTGGTSTAYTLSVALTNSVIQAGSTLSVNFHTPNGASATLAVNGGTAHGIAYSANLAIQANDIVSGVYYPVLFTGSQWVVFGVAEAGLALARTWSPTVSTSFSGGVTSTTVGVSQYFLVGDWVECSLIFNTTLGVGSPASTDTINVTLPVSATFECDLYTPAYRNGTGLSSLVTSPAVISSGNIQFVIGVLFTGGQTFFSRINFKYRRA